MPDVRAQALVFLAAASLAACGGGASGASPLPAPSVPGGTTPGAAVYDRSGSSCSVSYDGVMWYRVPSGTFSPIDVKHARCSSLGVVADPPRPRWAIPHGPTQTRFVATSFQQTVSIAGMESIEAGAAAHRVPVTWMLGNTDWLAAGAPYQRYHDANGDDVEAVPSYVLLHAMKNALPWYVPTVAALGAGHERNISGALAFHEIGFWGITWNSHGTDGTYDYGAPWGTYCADPTSYKRPDPSGACPLVAFEWTARDLTRGYLSGYEDYFSTDPDDLQQRAGFSVNGAQTYERELADAYAAAGETQPIVMVSQQESHDNTNSGDAQILDALYAQAAADGMKLETLRVAATDAQTFSAAPRAVAFPFIAGGLSLPSSIVNGQTLYPATIDYHDNAVGMTFLAGHTLPTRLFRYADDPVSRYNVPLKTFPTSELPTLTKASFSHGRLALQLQAPVAIRIGIALWSDPRTLRITQSGSIPAGRAGEVVIFDLQQGPNQVAIACPGCSGTTFPYST